VGVRGDKVIHRPKLLVSVPLEGLVCECVQWAEVLQGTGPGADLEVGERTAACVD